MRIVLAIVCLTAGIGAAVAEDSSASRPLTDHNAGRTVSPATQGHRQPQGATGPIDTTSGGAPAASPQGETPPGMQSAPEGSSKRIVDPK